MYKSIRIETDEQKKIQDYPFLEAKEISKSYDGATALIQTNFSCNRGEVHALIGENGAGKSTLVKILCGVVKSDTGQIYMNNKAIHIKNPLDAEKYGIVAVFQELSLVPNMSVAENVYLGHEPRNKFGIINKKQMSALTKELFYKLDLEIPSDSLVKDLPLAKQQLVEIVKALSREPELLIFDEATSALGNDDVDKLFFLINRLVTEENKAVIFISHRMSELERIAHRATIFRDSRFIKSFTWGSVDDKSIIEWIAGRSVEDQESFNKSSANERIILEVNNLSFKNKFRNISMKLKKGEVIGIAGLAGHGQSEFLKALYGAFPVENGELIIDSNQVKIKNPKEALKSGIALVPEDRKTDGLLLTRPMKENLVLSILDKIGKKINLGIINKTRETKIINNAVDMLDVKTGDINQNVSHLSGGNQQKVVLGKTIITGAQILILADPTRGIDIGTKVEIYKLIHNLSSEGISIILYSTELTELVRLCSRVFVFKQGEIVSELKGNAISENNIISYALGLEK